MAKNLLEQFITLFGDKLPGLKEQHDYPVYSKHSSGLSGVERYLAKQASAEQATATKHEGATGVEKYLARQAVAGQEAAAQAGPATGVEKYLAKQGSVEKKAATAQQKAPAEKVPPSRVEQYLADHGFAGEEAAAKDQTATRVAKYLADHGISTKETTVAQQPKPAVEDVIEQPRPVEQSAPKSPHIPKPSDNATQCQASTAKGTQCTRSVNLTGIKRTINEQDYQFTVCSQHNSANFKPYSAFIENQ